MDAVEFLKLETRMCRSFGSSCRGCPASGINNGYGYCCVNFYRNYPEKYVDIVEKWGLEHPENISN